MNSLVKLATVTGFGLALAGCSNMNVFKDSPSAPPPSAKIAAPAAPIAPVAPPMQKAAGPKSGAMTAGQIRQIIAGKTFNWQGPNNSGTTVFAQDGSSLFEVVGKGTAQGKWVARDGQLCESISPGTLRPEGTPLRCNSFSPAGGGKYQVGPAVFTPA